MFFGNSTVFCRCGKISYFVHRCTPQKKCTSRAESDPAAGAHINCCFVRNIIRSIRLQTRFANIDTAGNIDFRPLTKLSIIHYIDIHFVIDICFAVDMWQALDMRCGARGITFNEPVKYQFSEQFWSRGPSVVGRLPGFVTHLPRGLPGC